MFKHEKNTRVSALALITFDLTPDKIRAWNRSPYIFFARKKKSPDFSGLSPGSRDAAKNQATSFGIPVSNTEWSIQR